MNKNEKEIEKLKKEFEVAEQKQEKRERRIAKEHTAAKHLESKKKAKSKEAVDTEWWKLDNAALIYPSSTSKSWPAVFRVSVHLKEPVKAGILQQAVDDVTARFPFFNVRIRKGIFWYYFEEMPYPPVVKKESLYPCCKFDISSRKKHLFRVLYYNKKISVEFYHALCDGKGALKYITTLLYQYFYLQGIAIKEHDSFLNPLDHAKKEEVEDAFSRYADLKGANRRNTKKGYQTKGTPLEYGKQRVYTAVMDLAGFKAAAKKHGATITEYLMAAILSACEEERKVFKIFNRPVGAQIPVDLRKFFKTETLRNFTSFNYISLPVDFNGTFEDIIKFLREELAKITPEHLMKNINANVLVQRNKFIRLAPLAIKNWGLKLSTKLFGEKQVTTTVSNIGAIDAPPEFNELVDFYECVLGRSQFNNFITTCCSFNGKLTVGFTSKIIETGLIANIVKRFSDDGVEVFLISNKRD